MGPELSGSCSMSGADHSTDGADATSSTAPRALHIQTPSPRLDEALGGGWPVGGIIEFFGSPQVASYLFERLDFTAPTTSVSPDNGHDSLQAALLHLHVEDAVVVLRQAPETRADFWRGFLAEASRVTQRFHTTLFIYTGEHGLEEAGFEEQADARVQLSMVQRRQGSAFQALVLRAGSGRPSRSAVWKP